MEREKVITNPKRNVCPFCGVRHESGWKFVKGFSHCPGCKERVALVNMCSLTKEERAESKRRRRERDRAYHAGRRDRDNQLRRERIALNREEHNLKRRLAYRAMPPDKKEAFLARQREYNRARYASNIEHAREYEREKQRRLRQANPYPSRLRCKRYRLRQLQKSIAAAAAESNKE